MTTDFAFLPITELSQRIAAGTQDPRQLTEAFLDRADSFGQPLNCYVSTDRHSAMSAAEAAHRRASKGARIGPLDGIPIAIKDNIDVAGFPTTNGFGGPFAPAGTDAVVVARLKAAGAIILGKLNMQEGALGGVTDNVHHGRTINPFRSGHTPGGSSGGSGAAVAAGLCAATLGTDTGGSVRIPASYCGVVGFKPTRGWISTNGVVPLSRRLDHVGPLTRTVADARLMLDGMYAGLQPPDAAPSTASIGQLRLGVLTNLEHEDAEPGVKQRFGAALELLRGKGAQIRSVTLPSYDPLRARRAVFIRVEIEAAVEHCKLYTQEPNRFSAEMRGYLDWGLAAPAVRLEQADRIMAAAASDLAAVFNDVDMIVSPATPQAAFPFDQKAPDNQGTYSVLANLAGCPAISVPMGLDDNGLPVGLQLMGRPGEDRRVLDAAAIYEAAAGWRLRPPPPFGPPK